MFLQLTINPQTHLDDFDTINNSKAIKNYKANKINIIIVKIDDTWYSLLPMNVLE